MKWIIVAAPIQLVLSTCIEFTIMEEKQEAWTSELKIKIAVIWSQLTNQLISYTEYMTTNNRNRCVSLCSRG